MVAIGELGVRIGEGHGRAKLTDHDVELVVGLLGARDELIAQCRAAGMTRPAIDRTLTKAQLAYRHIAEKFEVSKSLVRHIANGDVRCQVAARWKRVEVLAVHLASTQPPTIIE